MFQDITPALILGWIGLLIMSLPAGYQALETLGFIVH
jgi:hypothetical protein